MLSSFFNTPIYVQLTPDRLTVHNPKTGVSISEVPEVAIVNKPKPTILAVGKEARTAALTSGAKISNPFSHPRTLVSDFTLGEQVLKAFVLRVQEKTLLKVSPRIIMHPLEEPAGGWTQIEIRALHEMALCAGATQVTIWQGVKLSNQDLLAGTFPASGKCLS